MTLNPILQTMRQSNLNSIIRKSGMGEADAHIVIYVV